MIVLQLQACDRKCKKKSFQNVVGEIEDFDANNPKSGEEMSPKTNATYSETNCRRFQDGGRIPGNSSQVGHSFVCQLVTKFVIRIWDPLYRLKIHMISHLHNILIYIVFRMPST